MKGIILITASYILEAERNEFWEITTGRPRKENEEYLKQLFPERIGLWGELCADRYYIKHYFWDYSKSNIVLCPICRKVLTNPRKPYPIHDLDNCVFVDGVEICPGCAYQMDLKIKNEGINAVIEKYRQDT